jgi:hypothetical protein
VTLVCDASRWQRVNVQPVHAAADDRGEARTAADDVEIPAQQVDARKGQVLVRMIGMKVSRVAGIDESEEEDHDDAVQREQLCRRRLGQSPFGVSSRWDPSANNPPTMKKIVIEIR